MKTAIAACAVTLAVLLPLSAPAVAQGVPAATPAGFANQFADLPGVRVRYQDTGQGPQGTVVFLHAGTGNTDSWENQLEVFSAAGYRAIAYDRRGYGRTLPNPASGPQPGNGAEDLDALVDYLKLEKFHLVGLANGAQTAMDYAAWRGDRLLSVVLAASVGPGENEKELAEFSRRIFDVTVLGGPERAGLREVGASFRGGNPEGFKRWLEIQKQSQIPGAPFQRARTPITYATLATIRVRTLVMAGGADLGTPPAFMKLWGAHIPDAEWMMVGDAGHAINTEQPEIFNQTVLAFIKGTRFEKVPK